MRLLHLHTISYTTGPRTETIEDVIYFENRYSLRGPATECTALYYETEEKSGEITVYPGDTITISMRIATRA